MFIQIQSFKRTSSQILKNFLKKVREENVKPPPQNRSIFTIIPEINFLKQLYEPGV